MSLDQFSSGHDIVDGSGHDHFDARGETSSLCAWDVCGVVVGLEWKVCGHAVEICFFGRVLAFQSIRVLEQHQFLVGVGTPRC